MQNVVAKFISPPRPCGYLPDRAAQFEQRLIVATSPYEMDAYLERGWRRFGLEFFRPICAGCAECVSLRIPVRRFSPTKSQRRVWRRCSEVRVEIGTPRADAERAALYRAWHAERERDRGWPENPLTLDDYAMMFCFPNECAREMAYFIGDKLVALGLVDESADALSSVYFFYDPAFAHLSLGVFSVMKEVEHAAARGRSFLYLGYRVEDCPSVAYKSHFRRHEALAGRPSFAETPLWTENVQ